MAIKPSSGAAWPISGVRRNAELHGLADDGRTKLQVRCSQGKPSDLDSYSTWSIPAG